MERMMRIELTPSAWKAEVLPLNYIRKMERKTRFELATLALARRCSTPEPLPQQLLHNITFHSFCQCFLVFFQIFRRSGIPMGGRPDEAIGGRTPMIDYRSSDPVTDARTLSIYRICTSLRISSPSSVTLHGSSRI